MFTVVDLFAGVGGLSHGFASNPEFEILFANEFDRDIASAYRLNHKNTPVICGDIRNVTEEQIMKITRGRQVDVVVGGPPCQSYSTLGKRQMDERASLFLEYKRILSILKPCLFLFENVSGLLSMQGGELVKKIKSEFEEIGYNVQMKLLDAAEYGVPQHRERIIIVGMKGANTFKYPCPTHGNGLLPFVTVEDALSDLPILNSGEEGKEYACSPMNDIQKYYRRGGSAFISDNVSPRNGERLLKIMQALPDGGTKADLPPELQPPKSFGNSYAKMWWKRPAPTITRNFATPSSARCVHPRDSRALTTREGARLQSFPDDYIFFGPTGTKNLSIGNAVPPLLSKALADSVLKALNEEGDKDA